MSLCNGEAYVEAVDLRIAGRGLDFVWARRYGSRNGGDTAMGRGWTHGYDVFLEAHGRKLWLNDGWGRRDRLREQSDGSYTCVERFVVGRRNADDTWTIQFPDTGSWRFHALDGTRAAGELISIQDRSSNTISLKHDDEGRLAVVRVRPLGSEHRAPPRQAGGVLPRLS